MTENKQVFHGQRIGQGFDVHALQSQPEATVSLGGVKLTLGYVVLAHSDGDTLIHAIADALLGAACLGDIGRVYPAAVTSEGFDSTAMLTDIQQWYRDQSLMINNIDSTIILQKPKLANYLPVMQENIAKKLQIETERVNVKATTTDYLGYIGRQEGIAAHSVVQITGSNR
jgi:2-C-methyl-D-erythritol 2,4-cyclodiphosphate synthase